jgi:hypothetical protein
MRILRLVFNLGLGLWLLPTSHAGVPMTEAKETVLESPFDKGKLELQVGTGVFSSFQRTTETRPGFTDIDAGLRLGTMLSSPSGEGILRGNCEFLVEGYGAALVEGPRTGYAGVTLVQWVPYFQLQAGGIYNDIYHDQPQRVFGRAIEFDLGGGFGMRYLFSNRCGLFFEADYRHISDAGTSARNLGLNSIGGLLGVDLFF